MSVGSVDLSEQRPFPNTIINSNITGATFPEDLFSMLETFEDRSFEADPFQHSGQSTIFGTIGNIYEEWMIPKPIDASREEITKIGKKRKISTMEESTGSMSACHKTSHITVERNRRKQMNEHLSVLRSLMPRFYVKRGDQASIIGGVVDYIKELQQVLQSLEAKKQRKICSEVLSQTPASSSCLLPHGPTLSLFSPKLGLPISPRTPLPQSPYERYIAGSYISNRHVLPALAAYPFSEIANRSFPEIDMVSGTAQAMADVAVEFSGSNVLLKTISRRIPGQVLKVVTALERLSLEVLHASISTVDGTLLNSFTVKIGVECDLSAEDLVQEIKHTFY